VKKAILILGLILIGLFLFGCTEENQQVTYKHIKDANIPAECASFENDACELFECMVAQCSCDKTSKQNPIWEGCASPGLCSYEFRTESSIKGVVEDFINYNNLELTDVKKAIKLNTVFWNVFVDNNGTEEVYVVVVDGSVIKPACGV